MGNLIRNRVHQNSFYPRETTVQHRSRTFDLQYTQIYNSAKPNHFVSDPWKLHNFPEVTLRGSQAMGDSWWFLLLPLVSRGFSYVI